MWPQSSTGGDGRPVDGIGGLRMRRLQGKGEVARGSDEGAIGRTLHAGDVIESFDHEPSHERTVARHPSRLVWDLVCLVR